MKRKLIGIVIVFTLLFAGVTGIFYISDLSINTEDKHAGQVVAVNEIEQLAKSGMSEEAVEKAAKLKQQMRKVESREQGTGDMRIFLFCGISIAFILVVFGYVYFSILRPFDKMKVFAEKIAQGNLELPLQYGRSNYFGAFTWAFDSMRREITKARACEREAVENNKTVIATLSHDIKTPIASIRAYAEGLEANLDATPEKRAKYLSVLMRKCDEVSKLTNDLFLHSMADLDKLKINPEEVELCGYIKEILAEIAAEREDIQFFEPDFKAVVSADKNRISQIVENLVNNARKYAKSLIDVTMKLAEHNVEIHFRDYGNGIPDEDMPFIFEQFYRGGNCGNEQGSGLGLYIVKYIAGHMGGTVTLHNHVNGLEAVVSLPLKEGS